MAVRFIVDVALALVSLPHVEVGSTDHVLEIHTTFIFRIKDGGSYVLVKYHCPLLCGKKDSKARSTSTGILLYFRCTDFTITNIFLLKTRLSTLSA
jgi:hypothetical protein